MTVRVPSAELSSAVRDCFRGAGLDDADAGCVASTLLDANLRGHDSHGVVRAPAYLRRVADGVAGGGERIAEPQGEGALRRIDAGGALGPIAANRGVELVAELVAESGIALAAVGNSSHFGAAGHYARRMAERELLGLVVTNGPANMAAHGSSEPFLGTNAFAVGVPLPEGDQFVLDMSCSVTARGRIIRSHELGERLEPGIALDSSGDPTQDPAAALAGAVLPFAGAKGSGLALAISLSVAMLSGASFDDEAGRMHGSEQRPQDIGHLFLAIDPWRLADPDLVRPRLSAFIGRLHGLRAAPGFDGVLYPGERGERERRARLEEGIPIDPGEIESIERTCLDLGYVDEATGIRRLLDRSRQ